MGDSIWLLIAPIAPVSSLVLCFLAQSAVVIWGFWSPVRTRATAKRGHGRKHLVIDSSDSASVITGALLFGAKSGGNFEDFGHP
ncbi:hypothetical protein B0186_07250 [Canicola haemoglobinophilus]|nr:hypothetical protein B0186_07250 [Canicola haemoglobinophilus]